MDPATNAALEQLARRFGWSADEALEIRLLIEGLGSTSPFSSISSTIDTDKDEDPPTHATDHYVWTSAKSGRYVDLGQIGEGSMGQVRRVRDPDLKRVMALKVIHPAHMRNTDAVGRFIGEAQATAQLGHPGIPAVHELGVLPDGRLYYTMPEIRGGTLSHAIASLHAERARDPQGTAIGFRHVVEAFHRLCEIMAYVHTRGVVHRDLKPQNVMLGSYGETLVLDWGLLKVLGDGTNEAPVETERTDHAAATRMGAVAGTPMYMPPEQAVGSIDRIGPWSDVYALGAILYEILSGRPPYAGSTAQEILTKLAAGEPPDPFAGTIDALSVGDAGTHRRRSGSFLPSELVAACGRAMAKDPAQRFPDAGALAAEIKHWLDGTQRREEARRLVREAEGQVRDAQAQKKRAVAERAAAGARIDALNPWDSESVKAPAWKAQDEAQAVLDATDLLVVKAKEALKAALQIEPTLIEAHAALAQLVVDDHAEAEARGDRGDVAQADHVIRQHVDALPLDHPKRVAIEGYLAGTGRLTLTTEPPGADVTLYRYEPYHRRIEARPFKTLGTTPVDLPLPMGSYVLVARAPGHDELRYPVHIERGQHWDGVGPKGEARPISLLKGLDADDCYVPEGWFWAGADAHVSATSLPRRRLWCDGFVVRRFPVTNAEYITFLDDLVDRGEDVLALRHAPQETPVAASSPGAQAYGRDAQGHFLLQADIDGDLWQPSWPVVMIDWSSARAYAAWLRARTQKPWRLLGELEWEKAARGVDGRRYPWGDFFDPTWANVSGSRQERTRLVPVDSFPLDQSPYGVRGLSGNVCDWCADPSVRGWPPLDGERVVAPTDDDLDVPARALRGGIWGASHGRAILTYRTDLAAWRRYSATGFRVGYSV